MNTLQIGLDRVTPATIASAQMARPTLVLTADSRARLERSHDLVRAAAGRAEQVYGLTTGVGSQKRHAVDQEERVVATFNRRLILDHCGGVGPDLPERVCYAIALTLLHKLALGGAGIAPEVVMHGMRLLNLGIVPVAPAQGSVGASDLSTCAAVAAAWFLGEGTVYRDGEIKSAAAALVDTDSRPPPLTGKDGLALLNVNAFSLGYGSLLADQAQRLFHLHLELVALSFEGFEANVSVLAPEVNELHRHSRQGEVAAILRDRLASAAEGSPYEARNLQDPLSFRCVPQVTGALLRRLRRLSTQLEADLNTVSDNPMVAPEAGVILSNGNFDTTDLCLEADAAIQAFTRVLLLSERRIDKLVSEPFSGLPTGLSDHPTAYGIGILNHTAASLAVDALGISCGGFPQLAPLAEGIEDVGAATPLALSRLGRLVDTMLKMMAIEGLVATTALRLRRPHQPLKSPLAQSIDVASVEVATPGGQAVSVQRALTHLLSPYLPPVGG